MPKLIKFPHIEQLRHVVATVHARAKFHEMPMPSLVFKGTPKLHGTNASVCLNTETMEFWTQSREQIITPENDNMGFSRWAHANREALHGIFSLYMPFHVLGDKKAATVVIYGEWCGKGIMKKVGIAELPKMFVIFGVRILENEPVLEPVLEPGFELQEMNEMDAKAPGWDDPNKDDSIWAQQSFGNIVSEDTLKFYNELSIYDINQFKGYLIKIDFTTPEASLEELIKLTSEVEAECPVARQIGNIKGGLGEGIVWICTDHWYKQTELYEGDLIRTNDLRFKTKGEKHKEAAHEKIAVDPEKVANIQVFVTNVVTDNRLEKMVEKMKIAGIELIPQNIPELLKLVGEDVLREEGDVLEASGLDRKDVMKAVNFAARNWFLAKYKAFEL